MSKYSECMCKVCEQKRVAAAEVDKLQGMLVKPMSADHEKQYVEVAKMQPDFEQLKKFEKMAVAAAAAEQLAQKQNDVRAEYFAKLEQEQRAHVALIEELQNKILKQDKQFLELAQENEKIKGTISENCKLRKHINSLNSQSKSLFNSLAAATKTNFERTAEIKDLEYKLETAQQESEYWRLRAQKNSLAALTGVQATMDHHIDFSAHVIDPGKIAKEITEQIKKNNGFYNGGCV